MKKLTSVLLMLLLISSFYLAQNANAATPTVSTIKITGGNEITIVYSEAVNTVVGDYTDLKGAIGARSVTAAIGSGTPTIILTFDGAAVNTNATATIDIAATVTSVSTSDGLLALDDQAVADGQSPTVALSYSANPAKVGTTTITATYSESIVGTTTISINQPGSTDISNQDMSSNDQTVWTYDYIVNVATGSTYIDGVATTSISVVADAASNDASAPTSTTFTIDTAATTLAITSPSASSTVGSSTVFAFTSSEPGTQECNIDDGSWETCATGDAFSTLSDFGGLSQVAFTLNLRDTDTAGNVSTTSRNFIKDVTAPTVAEVSAIQPSSLRIPTYTFTTTEPGTITYGGDCSSATVDAASGTNSVVFNSLGVGVHSNCTINVTDAADNISNTLTITAFTIRSSGGGRSGGPGTPPPTITAINAPMTLLPSQEGTQTHNFGDQGSVTLYVPKGAVSAQTTFRIQMSAINANERPDANSGNVVIGNKKFEISATDSTNNPVTNFNKSLTITLQLPDMPSTSTGLGVYYLNSTNNKWLLVAGSVFDLANKKVTFQVNHLTKFAVIKAGGQSTIDVTKEKGKTLTQYADGSLVRGTNKMIFVIMNGKKMRILNLVQLRNYAGIKINDVSDDIINQYPETALIILKPHKDGSLVRENETKKIYFIMGGKKLYIKNLKELWKFRHLKTINTSSNILGQYPSL